MKKYTVQLLVLAALMTAPPAIRADVGKVRRLDGIEVLSGYGHSRIRCGRDDYDLVPFMFDLDVNLHPLPDAQAQGRRPLHLQIEPFFSKVERPEDGREVGLSFFLRWGLLPRSSRFQLYLKGGLGGIHISPDNAGQSTHFNFTEQVGLGASWAFSPRVSLLAEARFRHLSNAHIREPNPGINTLMLLTGLAFPF